MAKESGTYMMEVRICFPARSPDFMLATEVRQQRSATQAAALIFSKIEATPIREAITVKMSAELGVGGNLYFLTSPGRLGSPEI